MMINTTLCYIEKDDSYLLLHRVKKNQDINKGKWIGIGGKFEENESPYDCVKREVKEETGLELQKVEYRGLVTFVSTDKNGTYNEMMHLFWSDSFTGVQKKSEDCDEGELAWVPKSKMNELPHWESDELFLDLIEKRVPFFSLKCVYKDGVLVDHLFNE